MGPNHPSPHINLTREVQNKRKPSMQFLTIAYFCWSRVLHDHRSVGPKSACVICFSPMGFHHYSPISHKPTRASLCSPSTPLHAHFRQILPDAYPAPGSDRYAVGSSPIRFLDGVPPDKICIPHGCIKSQSNHLGFPLATLSNRLCQSCTHVLRSFCHYLMDQTTCLQIKSEIPLYLCQVLKRVNIKYIYIYMETLMARKNFLLNLNAFFYAYDPF